MKRRLIITGLVVVLCTLTQGGGAMSETHANEQFEIHVLRERLIDVLPYDYEKPAWKKLLQSHPANYLILTDNDIEFYRWQDQEIVLTSSATERIKWLDPFGEIDGFALSEKSFVVYLGSQPLFGGSFIEEGSARAIDYPVIYVDRSRPQIVLQVRPTHTVLQRYEQLSQQIKGRIELPAVKRHFKTLGRLR
jgi:hypothetical protein